jgi:hypothetical protein
MSDDLVMLRPVLENDLPMLEQFLMDPEATGEPMARLVGSRALAAQLGGERPAER